MIRRLLAAWGPVILCEAVVIFLSSRPNLAPPPLFPNVDKAAHFVEYAGLGGLIYRALRWSGASRRRAGLVTVLLAAILAAGDESFQAYIPGRVKSLGDWTADCVGSIAGSLAMRGLESLLPAGWARPPRRLGEGERA